MTAVGLPTRLDAALDPGPDGAPSPTTLEQVAASRGVSHRDCRTCPHLEAQGDGLGYGWCRAHGQFVKWYHPAGEFWSQCQFKSLARERRPRPDDPSA